MEYMIVILCTSLTKKIHSIPSIILLKAVLIKTACFNFKSSLQYFHTTRDSQDHVKIPYTGQPTYHNRCMGHWGGGGVGCSPPPKKLGQLRIFEKFEQSQFLLKFPCSFFQRDRYFLF